MITDDEVTRARIAADVVAASDGGRRALSTRWLADYTIDQTRIPLIDQQGRGIRNRDGWGRTLSITTVEKGRYPDRQTQPGIWQYPYAINKHGKLDPSNTKLFQAHADRVPLLYFYKPTAHTYLFVGTVLPIARDDNARELTIALVEGDTVLTEAASVLEREWAQTLVQRRLHQPRFRAIVLSAYGAQCAICGLPDAALLDAAHIRGDKDPNGQPVVENGIALCSIHHRAYDNRQIGIDPELGLHVRPDILALSDGPVWEHGLQRLAGSALSVVPAKRKNRPDPYRLELTFKEFLAGL